MAINIKNERVCALIRRASEETARSQTSVLEEALERYLADLATAPGGGDRVERVLARIDAQLTDESKAALRRDMADLYDESGLPA